MWSFLNICILLAVSLVPQQPQSENWYVHLKIVNISNILCFLRHVGRPDTTNRFHVTPKQSAVNAATTGSSGCFNGNPTVAERNSIISLYYITSQENATKTSLLFVIPTSSYTCTKNAMLRFPLLYTRFQICWFIPTARTLTTSAMPAATQRQDHAVLDTTVSSVKVRHERHRHTCTNTNIRRCLTPFNSHSKQ